jgi:hypothetical protein
MEHPLQKSREVCDRKIIWKLYLGRIEAMAFNTLTRVDFQLKTEQLGANIKITFRKLLSRSLTTEPTSSGNWQQTPVFFQITAPTRRRSSYHWQLSKARTDPRFECRPNLQNSLRVWSYYKIKQAATRNLASVESTTFHVIKMSLKCKLNKAKQNAHNTWTDIILFPVRSYIFWIYFRCGLKYTMGKERFI